MTPTSIAGALRAKPADRPAFPQRYLKSIRYGNRAPRVAGEDLSLRKNWLFEVVFDYGEHDDVSRPRPPRFAAWPVREDPFSLFRSTFDVRTYRLCRRVLMFHHFPEELKERKTILSARRISTTGKGRSPRSSPRSPSRATCSRPTGPISRSLCRSSSSNIPKYWWTRRSTTSIPRASRTCRPASTGPPIAGSTSTARD